MQDSTQTRILRALLIALRPLARALLRAGIGYREFEEISKCAFVDVSTRDYGLRGRPTNISRVAVMTGLTRKEVRRIREKSEFGHETDVNRPNPMALILHRWFTSEEYLNEKGNPRDLSFDGPGTTFSSLVKKFGGDIPPGAMRTELKRINAVEELDGGKLRCLKRNVSDLELDDRLVNGLANQLHPAALALAHNICRSSEEESWIQRSVSTNCVRPGDLPRVRRISTERLTEFTANMDDLFSAYETLYDKDEVDKSERAIGVGVFYFEEDKSETDIFA